MSELLRDAARHLRHQAQAGEAPNAVVVVLIGEGGTATSCFFGEAATVETAAAALPGIAADITRQLCASVGLDAIESRAERPASPDAALTAERIAAQVVGRARTRAGR